MPKHTSASAWFVDVLGLFILCLLVSTGTSAATSSLAPLGRQAGLGLQVIGVGTKELDDALPTGLYAPLGQRMLLTGVDSSVGGDGDWTIGGFAYGGIVTSTTASHRAELRLRLIGVSVDTTVQSQSGFEYTLGLRAGAGRFTLSLIDLSQAINSIEDAGTAPTTTTLQMPVWHISPYAGLRTQLSAVLSAEATVGYGFSMSSGEWYHNGQIIDRAPVRAGGPTLGVALRLALQ